MKKYIKKYILSLCVLLVSISILTGCVDKPVQNDRVQGSWHLNLISSEGESYSAEELGLENYSFTFDGEGKVVVDDGSEKAEMKYSLSENSVIFEGDDGSTFTASLESESVIRLVDEENGITMDYFLDK